MTTNEIEINSKKDAKSFEIWTNFGFDENTAFAFAMQEPIKKEQSAEEVIASFEPSEAKTSDVNWSEFSDHHEQ